MQIYLSKDGNQYGPYDIEQLRYYVEQKNFSISDLACYDGKNWVQVSQVPGLVNTFPQSPPAPPKPVTAKSPKRTKNRKKGNFLSGCLGLIIFGLVLGGFSKMCSTDSSTSLDDNENERNQGSTSSKSSNKEKRWFDYADLHTADLAQWKVAAQKNKIATAADWLAATKWKGHLNSPDDFDRLKVKAVMLSAAVDESAADPDLGYIKAREVGAMIITSVNDLDP
jgi:hypothetical protein